MAEQNQPDFKMEIGVNFDGTARASFVFNELSVTVNQRLLEPWRIKGLEKPSELDDTLELLTNTGFENTAEAIEKIISGMSDILFEIGTPANGEK